jgi:leucyl/phenylalanyl-tRNA--protein transferase
VVPWLSPGDPFPPVARALRDPNGLLAAGAELTMARLLEAYSRGIFPWFNEDDPVLWWSPDPRMVLFTDELRVSRSLGKTIRSGVFSVTFDTSFEDVMRGCAEPRAGQDGTWISESMLEAYTSLAAAGYAHSVEVWSDSVLVGGVYGVSIGRMFFGESMFSRVSNASKVGLALLCRQLRRWSFDVIDCQLPTSHLASLGAREIRRSTFVALVDRLSVLPGVAAPWHLDPDLIEGA